MLVDLVVYDRVAYWQVEQSIQQEVGLNTEAEASEQVENRGCSFNSQAGTMLDVDTRPTFYNLTILVETGC